METAESSAPTRAGSSTTKFGIQRKCLYRASAFLSLDTALLLYFCVGLIANWHPRAFYIAGAPIATFSLAVVFSCLASKYITKTKQDVQAALDAIQVDMEADAEFLKTLSGLPTRFSFQALQAATQNFGKKLGHGGFGSVYDGTLPDGSRVAVKRLEREGNGHKAFCAEVATISRIRHVNLVCLKGFCTEGAERLLVYEFMPKGSLDAWIFQERASWSPLPSAAFVVLSWETRYSIALETARGLAYLHEECEERILHLDVKPQNILLDELFHAKVSDFGLSRSMDRGESRVVTTVRGTPGYLAPEWLREGGIGSQTDVYSYGMVVLELVSGRRCLDSSLANPDHWFLPTLAFKKLEEDHLLDMVDPLLNGRLDEQACLQAYLMLSLALWCIQEDVGIRPRMSSVVRVLEGTVAVERPPKPTLHSTLDSPRFSITSISAETLTLPR